MKPYGEMHQKWRAVDPAATAEDPPGTGSGQSLVNHLFTGYERDFETGYDYAQARYYDPEVARFMAVDPMVMTNLDLDEGMARAMRLGSLSVFSYTDWMPVIATDPTGMEFLFAGHKPDADGNAVRVAPEQQIRNMGTTRSSMQEFLSRVDSLEQSSPLFAGVTRDAAEDEEMYIDLYPTSSYEDVQSPGTRHPYGVVTMVVGGIDGKEAIAVQVAMNSGLDMITNETDGYDRAIAAIGIDPENYTEDELASMLTDFAIAHEFAHVQERLIAGTTGELPNNAESAADDFAGDVIRQAYNISDRPPPGTIAEMLSNFLMAEGL